uniref:Uncharacterized protein n=1 Tax=Hyaloperonospora arabidopsidis (strain Emoy2) TaxID=559515 RepID=M4BP69_HYAAE
MSDIPKSATADRARLRIEPHGCQEQAFIRCKCQNLISTRKLKPRRRSKSDWSHGELCGRNAEDGGSLWRSVGWCSNCGCKRGRRALSWTVLRC